MKKSYHITINHKSWHEEEEKDGNPVVNHHQKESITTGLQEEEYECKS